MELPHFPIKPGERLSGAYCAQFTTGLHPEETRFFGSVSERRLADLVRGRTAARKALGGLLGDDVSPIVTGLRGEPLFPAGILGSITHKGLDAAAIVGDSRDFAVLGIDLESFIPRKTDIGPRIATPAEIPWIQAGGERAVRMLFSAKESIYKALAPVVGRYIGFQEASLTWCETEERENEGLFSVELLGDWSLSREIRDGFVVRVAMTTEAVITLALSPRTHRSNTSY